MYCLNTFVQATMQPVMQLCTAVVPYKIHLGEGGVMWDAGLSGTGGYKILNIVCFKIPQKYVSRKPVASNLSKSYVHFESIF